MEPKKVNDYTWKIEKQGQMRVPAIIFASEALMKKIREDRTLQQAANVATLPGIVKHSLTMPDAHEGYGFPIGGVAAFDLDEGIISPGGVGYDINCGVRLLRTDFTERDIANKRKELLDEIFKEVPAGVGRAGITKLSRDVLLDILENGAEWALRNGYGKKDDLLKCEENGKIKGANHNDVSSTALARGMPQLGTLGSGNHFLEFQKVDKIYDEKVAKLFGIDSVGQVTVMIHCGSRGIGHQIASDYIQKMESKYGFRHLADRELVNAPINSDLGKQYYSAMCCAINYAFCNRQMIAHWVRDVFSKV
ncbi:MAG: RtcB family protein, partial [archaeon]